MDLLDLAAKFGLPTFLLVVFGLGVWKGMWPFAVKAWEDQQSERKEERTRFLDALKDERAAFKEMVIYEKSVRIEEREKFLNALDRQADLMTEFSRQLMTVSNALLEVKRAMVSSNDTNARS